ALRRKRLTSQRGHRATDLVTLLLKKRLFSSPAAFAHTVGVYLETLERRSGRLVPVADDADAGLDDETARQNEDDALDRAIPLQTDDPTADADREIALLRRMEEWAVAHEAQP